MNPFKTTAFVVLLFCCIHVGRSQSVLIQGYVKDLETGTILPYANVYETNLKHGTTTNRLGHFSLWVTTSDSISLRASFVGYQIRDTVLRASNAGPIELNFFLSSRSIDIDEVNVVGQAQFFDQSSHPSTILLRGGQISTLPAPGEKDLLRALQRYPGISSQSEMSSNLYIRGGTPDQTLIQLDGITVYNPSHVFGFYSMFDTDAIKAVKVLKGGFPAEYGMRMGSVLDILSIDGDRNSLSGNASLGLINSGILINGPLLNGGWMFSGRRSYIDLVNKLLDSALPLPDYHFYDLHTRLVQQIDNDHLVALTALYNLDKLDFVSRRGNNSIDEAAYSKWSNRLMGVEWGASLSAATYLRTILSSSEYHGDLEITQNLLLASFPGGTKLVNFANRLSDLSFRSEIEFKISDGHEFKAGLFFTNFSIGYSSNASLDYISSDIAEEYSVLGGMVQDKIKISSELSATPGLRMTSRLRTDRLFVEPRLVINYRLTENLSARFGAGRYYQWLSGGQPASFLTFSGIDFWFPVDDELPPPNSIQLSGDLAWMIQPNFEVILSAYRSWLSNVSMLRPPFDQSANVIPSFFVGKGDNYGMEVMVEGSQDPFRVTAGYALSWSFRKYDEINDGEPFPTRYDKRHSISFNISYKPSATWELGASWVFSTGQAYTGILGYYDLDQLAEGPPEGVNGGNSLHFVLSRTNEFRLPPYHRLDLNATRTFNYESWKLRLRLDVFNAYNRLNALGATTGFSDDPYYRFLPIVPTITVEAEF